MEYIECLRQNYHMQGFSSDSEYMYWSFTDSIVKTTLSGTMVAQTHVYGGHLGDIDVRDGFVYGSWMGNAAPGHAWDDWSGFKILVYDCESLTLQKEIRVDECYGYKEISESEGDTRGFRGIDGICFAPDKNGETKMFIACALACNERFTNQIILQHSLSGQYETEHYIATGNTMFGIQNLDYDGTTGEFWFTTYGAEKPYHARETLYRIAPDLKTVKAKYRFSTPYGFDCLGNGSYYASLQGGVNGDRNGIAYKCGDDMFGLNMTETEINEYIRAQL